MGLRHKSSFISSTEPHTGFLSPQSDPRVCSWGREQQRVENRLELSKLRVCSEFALSLLWVWDESLQSTQSRRHRGSSKDKENGALPIRSADAAWETDRS